MGINNQLLEQALAGVEGITGKFVVQIDKAGVKVSEATPIIFCINSENSYEAWFKGGALPPEGIELEVRDYGVSGLDTEGDYLEEDDEGRYKVMY